MGQVWSVVAIKKLRTECPEYDCDRHGFPLVYVLSVGLVRQDTMVVSQCSCAMAKMEDRARCSGQEQVSVKLEVIHQSLPVPCSRMSHKGKVRDLKYNSLTKVCICMLSRRRGALYARCLGLLLRLRPCRSHIGDDVVALQSACSSYRNHIVASVCLSFCRRNSPRYRPTPLSRSGTWSTTCRYACVLRK